jgi:hypothetical protein
MTKYAKKGVSIINNNKQLSKLRDQAIDQAVNYGSEKLGINNEQNVDLIKKISSFLLKVMLKKESLKKEAKKAEEIY